METYPTLTITKLGHSCLLIRGGKCTFLTDPGMFTVEEVKELKKLDALFISDEHSDHLHIDSVKILFINNPEMKIFTQKSVCRILKEQGIESTPLLHGEQTTLKGMRIEGIGKKHAPLHPAIPQTDNTGYLFGESFFYPGDALTKPEKPVKILALPVAGPWLKIAEAVDYAIEVAPKYCFPVHEGILKSPGSAHRIPAELLPKHGIAFRIPAKGEEMEFE